MCVTHLTEGMPITFHVTKSGKALVKPVSSPVRSADVTRVGARHRQVPVRMATRKPGLPTRPSVSISERLL